MILRTRWLVLWVLFLSLTLAAGCETAKGFTTGVSSTAEGAAKDAASIWQGILQIDTWIRQNLW
jgi:predicted small secreted protein